MEILSNQTCEACRVDAPLATAEETASWMTQLTDWQIQSVDNIKRLVKVYKFNNFVDALAFTNQVGELAESLAHHPAILTEWGQVTVSWWTHKIGGLHKNDFICAAKTDSLYPS
ncbi:pterin-4-alpha-carbinolamine dehydratase [Catenovulum agarivorans DS-2]|uniref:Putative pterin-4-alpha-carbinolamine dehydratase n=1 Tax=Catenovulum agarivorans DS-2 TaxID=1328313 RepID=W7QVV8_9ALTE|nr:4a-hydroxytetrahydrobiopterin dehydratase [Catenovulum agarivorans]EWH11858.1 pterin-4-alpha-carbinolamine dehydratase [Catenovulum agarivorans DS-2]